jgi:hypothetical protein
MATITIIGTILTNNIGDGWTDIGAAAKAAAATMRATYERDMAEFVNAGHDVEIKINVSESDVAKTLDVYIDGNVEIGDVMAALTDENTIYQDFFESDEAERLYL